jgi:Xaa-Pro aminopeptidase
LTDHRTDEQARKEASDFEVEPYEAGVRGPQAVREMVEKLGIHRLGFESLHLPYAIYRDIRDGARFELRSTEDVVDRLRIVKDAAEMAHLQAAVDVLDRCFAHLVAWLEPGMTERQVAREVERYLLEHADGTSFPSIVASGPNGSMPHAVPTDRRVEEGEGVTIDIGARVAGYCSDMTRTICLGEPTNSLLLELHAIVLEAQEATEQAIRPGMTGTQADAIARDLIASHGYGTEFTHSTGHGIGLEVHEPPWLSKIRGSERLRPGMVFSVEPGIYLPGVGGVRIEDLVVLEEEEVQVLTRSPKELLIARRTS